MQLSIRTKSELREKLLRERRALSPQFVTEASERLRTRLGTMSCYGQARAVALYWPIAKEREVDLRTVDAELRSRGTAVFYPAMPANPSHPFGFRQVRELDELRFRGRGFCEPEPSSPLVNARQLDLILVPAVGATTSGQRLGFGSGFYDRVLPAVGEETVALVVAFECQIVGSVFSEEHDVPCSGVVTESHIYG